MLRRNGGGSKERSGDMSIYTRREFLEISMAAAAGAAVLSLPGCGAREKAYEGLLEVPAGGYPLIEASGTHFEIGFQLGSAMKETVADYFEVAGDYRESVAFFVGEGRAAVEAMLTHARAAFPRLVEEIEGMAEGVGVPFRHLFAYNCRSEIGIMKDPPGCSTFALRDGDRAVLVHNEDGNDLNRGRMYLARVTPPSGVTFLAFVYPGLMPGNGPAVNSSGIVETTNYIQPKRVAEGIPRYFLSRAVLEAADLDEAVDIVTTGPRAFPFHHNLLSLGESRILSVETAAYPEMVHDVMEVDGLYLHTNHFLHPAMTGEAGKERPYDVPYVSSTTRLDVLRRAMAEKGEPADAEEMVGMLSLHEGRPYSPCRHPEGDVHGVTLGTAVFETPFPGMTLYHGNPCEGLKKKHAI